MGDCDSPKTFIISAEGNQNVAMWRGRRDKLKAYCPQRGESSTCESYQTVQRYSWDHELNKM